MKACGLVVEYNPFHNGHQYHVNQAKQASNADCVIAIMSGPFLQRGEPAIIDKFHRAKAALHSGVDIVLELPYIFAVQSSEYFGMGAILTLNEIGVSHICFGSESGQIEDFTYSYHLLNKNKQKFDETIQYYLNQGYSFPKASDLAYEKIGLKQIDMLQPNNILGMSYVTAIIDNDLPIKPLTIKRIHSNYHDEEITSNIASATSIRQSLINKGISVVEQTFPTETLSALNNYKNITGQWHTWEDYFPFLIYRILTMDVNQLKQIKGVDEGLEHRIKEKAENATSFLDLMNNIKTKRYTWTRLQRMFTHILTNTLKKDYDLLNIREVPYIRLLGMTSKGKQYLNTVKKDLNVPLLPQLSRNHELSIDEKASRTYYSILSPEKRNKMFHQEISRPIII